MPNSLPRILIGAPVRNRAWVLPYYLAALERLDYPKELLTFCFILNDSTDNSRELLFEFAKNHSTTIIERNQCAPEDREDRQERDRIYGPLAEVRNLLLSIAANLEIDYLFSVDSDIIVPPDILTRLLAHRKDIVAALIYNDYHFNAHENYPNRFPNIMIRREGLQSYRDYPLNSLFEVDVTGAVYLLSRKVIRKVRYGYHPQGEDIYFCQEAKERGFSLWCDSSIFCQHIMTRDQLKEFKQKGD